ncbi:MAG: hypothetical protein ACFFE4_19820 [Candidatus Thorarchaeota archaeon]
MDTAEDFITPEFLNIVFFQQKNLVIFPHVDMKHLHTLEIFTPNYTPIDLESTALHDLKNMLEFESENTYSQSPTLYFIHSLNKEKVKEVMSIDGIRCILNSNEDVSELANSSNFIFFNKKKAQFLNYHASQLNFERFLISSSQDATILQDTIQRIKSIATRIFAEINRASSYDNLPELLKDFDLKYWQKIIDFTGNFYDVNVPKASELKKLTPYQILKKSRKEHLTDFSEEYRRIIESNKLVGKEFAQLLHEYRSKKVNPSHLELDELFSPLLLYNYLRNRHWKKGIPEDFQKEWFENVKNYNLPEDVIHDIESVCSELGLITLSIEPFNLNAELSEKKLEENIPSIQTDWDGFKTWLLARIDNIERIRTVNTITSENSFISSLDIWKIPNKDVQKCFKSGENYFNTFKNSKEDLDYSPVVSQYSKGFEIILHEKLSSTFTDLITKYHNFYINKKISPDFHQKFGNLMRNNSISIGTWSKILSERNKPQHSIEIQDFYNRLRQTFTDHTLTIIEKVCRFVSKKRNPSSHNKTINLQEIRKIREKLLNSINNVVKQLYYFESNIPSISDFSQFKSWVLNAIKKIELKTIH